MPLNRQFTAQIHPANAKFTTISVRADPPDPATATTRNPLFRRAQSHLIPAKPHSSLFSSTHTRAADEVAAAAGLGLESRSLARFEPVAFDAAIVDKVARAAEARGHSHRRMPSGAGYDAQMLARIAPAGMIFVHSIAGISHNPAEHTTPEDLEAGANLLLDVMLELAGVP